MHELLTFEQWMASQLPQVFGQTITYQVGSNDGARGSRRVLGFSAPHYLARPWGISLGPPPRAVPAGAVAAVGEMSVDINRALCVLEWGCGGFLQTLELDWRQGGQITLYASSLTVACRMPVASTQQVRIGAAACPTFGGVPNRGTFTAQLGQVLLTASASVAIPRGAVSVVAQMSRGNPLSSLAYHYQFLRSNGAIVADAKIGLGGYVGADYNQTLPVPIPTDAAVVIFTNDSAAANMTNVELQFGLAF